MEIDKTKDVNVSDMSAKSNEGQLEVEEQQKEFSATQLMLIRHIRNVIAQKKLSLFKQQLITDYIEY
ncbi:hypothetical protein T4E_1394, partial [Trichinella pseudospiralis]